MSEDVVIGVDGKPRCAWAGAEDTAFSRYHDTVWGKRTGDESALFEALTLGVFQAGLSWSIVFRKRDDFRRAFHDFNFAQVAAMIGRDVDRLAGRASSRAPSVATMLPRGRAGRGARVAGTSGCGHHREKRNAQPPR